MFKKKFTYLCLIAILCLSLVVVTGCSQTEEPNPPVTEAPVPNPEENTTTPAEDKTAEETAKESDVKQAKEIADKIVKDVAEVEKASVLVTGETAYVGLKINDTADATKSKEIKASAEKVVKDADAKIKTVMISEDMDIMTRLEGYGKDLEEGKPIKGFEDEMKTMFDRVVPSN